MGASVSVTPSTSTSKRININDTLNEKEFVFLVLQTEIDRMIRKTNYKDLHHIEREVKCHIKELKSLIRYNNWKPETVERVQRLIYNYEISLAKVKSCIFNTISKDRVVRRNKEQVDENDTYENVARKIPSMEAGEDNAEMFYGNDIHVSKDEVNSNLMEFSDTDTDSDGTDEPMYANIADLELICANRQSSRLDGFRGAINKPPIPNPRSRYDGLVKEVPNLYERLNEILDKDNIDSSDIEEVLNIRRKTNKITNIFKGKMDEIFRRYEETVAERINNEEIV